MAKLTYEMLERYHDGELSPRQAQWVEQRLDESPEHRETLAKMTRMSDLLTIMNEENLADVSFAGFEERVRAGVRQAEQPGAWERFKVWASEFLEHRQVVWVPSVAVATIAVAVIIALPFVSGSPSGTTAGPADPGIWQAASTDQPPGSKIVSVNFGETTGMKYDVPYSKGGTVGVVWIME